MSPDTTLPPSLSASAAGPARLRRRHVLGLAAGAAASVALPSAPAHAAGGRQSQLVRFSGRGFTGAFDGVLVTDAGLRWGRGGGRATYADAHAGGRRIDQDLARWTSPVVPLSVPATQAIASWNASTPWATAVRVKLRVRSTSGAWSRWFTMALWTSQEADASTPVRTTTNGQSDAVARVATDTVVAASGTTLDAVQVAVELARKHGTATAPSVRQVCVVASTTPSSSTPVSPVGAGAGRSIALPAYSQMVHEGHYPAWNGGGEAWCSATSTAMVLGHFGVGASATETAWVRPAPHADAVVEHVVRGVWDAGYGGTGNWPFNTAWAGARGLDAFVTRLRSLAEAELFIAAGIPLVVSTSFSSSQLTGAGFGTNGHLMVIRGFTAAGNVMVHDPASGMAASDALVPRTYDRAQFESAWGRSGGTTYVMRPASVPLPARVPGAAW